MFRGFRAFRGRPRAARRRVDAGQTGRNPLLRPPRFAAPSMGKSKRDEKAAEKDGDYEFKLPDFDEKAFIRREVRSARASFYTLGIGVLAGAVATAVNLVAPERWQLGWLPIFGAMFALRPILQRSGFGDESTSWKALTGAFFMLFFTALSIWIVGVNVV